MAVIFIQPVGNVLDIHGFLFGRDCLFHGDDVHADAVASGRHQVGLAFQRKERHLIKAFRQFRIFLDLPQDHVGHLSDAGNEQLHVPLFSCWGFS